jgi:hypothetical protein
MHDVFWPSSYNQMLGNYSWRFCKGSRIFGARLSSSPGLPVVGLLCFGWESSPTRDHEPNNPRQQEVTDEARG